MWGRNFLAENFLVSNILASNIRWIQPRCTDFDTASTNKCIRADGNDKWVNLTAALATVQTRWRVAAFGGGLLLANNTT